MSFHPPRLPYRRARIKQGDILFRVITQYWDRLGKETVNCKYCKSLPEAESLAKRFIANKK